jgi:hypothetical protein
LDTRQPDQPAFPVAVQSKALQVIHQVVLSRDPREELFNAVGSLVAWMIKLVSHARQVCEACRTGRLNN